MIISGTALALTGVAALATGGWLGTQASESIEDAQNQSSATPVGGFAASNMPWYIKLGIAGAVGIGALIAGRYVIKKFT